MKSNKCSAEQLSEPISTAASVRKIRDPHPDDAEIIRARFKTEFWGKSDKSLVLEDSGK